MLLDMNEQFNKAQEIVMNQKATMAELSSAFDIFTAFQNMHPRNPMVIFGLATVSARRKQIALAVLLYEIYLKLETIPYKQGGAYLNIGKIYHDDGKKDIAMGYFNKAVEACSECKEEDAIDTLKLAHINIAGNTIASGDPESALKLLNDTIEKYPSEAETFHLKFNKGMVQLELGEYGEGFDAVNDYLPRHDCREYTGEGSPPTWDGTKGKTVIVYGEQGIGDEIMFASMIPDLMKDCNVIMDAHLRLAEMFRNSFDIPVYATREFNCIRWKHDEKIDYKIPIGSLGKWYRREEKDFPGAPYLKADEKLKSKLKDRLNKLGDKPCIGISWRGGTKSTNKEYRNIPLEMLKPLLEMDVNWISLNYQDTTGKLLEEFHGKTGLKIHHWKDVIDDYDMTAALVSNLDLVISIPQSVVHLAGSLGTPVWQMCPKKAMWQMGRYGKEMPWYKCARNFWQDESMSWDTVIETIKGELTKWNLLPKNIAA